MSKLFPFAFLLLFALPAFAQKQNVYFLKNDGRYVDNRDSADYFRIVREPDSTSNLYNVLEYYMDGKKKLIGKSSRIIPPVYEGQCATFYENGQKKTLEYFKNGNQSGSVYEYYTNGQLYVVKAYPENYDRFKSPADNYLITDSFDSTGSVAVKGGQGYFKSFDEKFKYINEEGKIKNGKRDSIWVGNFKDFKITFKELYKNGILLFGSSIDENGNEVNYRGTRSTNPEFDGGVEAFGKYLGENIHYPTDARENNIQGKVILQFVVDKIGNIVDIKIKSR